MGGELWHVHLCDWWRVMSCTPLIPSEVLPSWVSSEVSSSRVSWVSSWVSLRRTELMMVLMLMGSRSWAWSMPGSQVALHPPVSHLFKVCRVSSIKGSVVSEQYQVISCLACMCEKDCADCLAYLMAHLSSPIFGVPFSEWPIWSALERLMIRCSPCYEGIMNWLHICI